jgi:hypothetical protein
MQIVTTARREVVSCDMASSWSQIWPWNVRLITSLCCSASATKLTACPDTRIVAAGTVRFFIASSNVSVDDVQIHVEAALAEVHVDGDGAIDQLWSERWAFCGDTKRYS